MKDNDPQAVENTAVRLNPFNWFWGFPGQRKGRSVRLKRKYFYFFTLRLPESILLNFESNMGEKKTKKKLKTLIYNSIDDGSSRGIYLTLEICVFKS